MRTYRSLLALTAFQFRGLYRDKIALIFNLIVPVVMVAIFGAMYGGSDTAAKLPIGLVDNDGAAAAQSVRQAIDGSNLYDVRTGAEADLLNELRQGKVRAVVILPEGMTGQIAAKQAPATITIRWDSNSQSSGAAMTTLQSLIGRQNAVMVGAQPVLVTRAEELPVPAGMKMFDFLLPGQIVYALLSAGVMSVAISLAISRQSGSLRHLFSTPLSIGMWTVSRMAANMVMSVLQLIILYGTAMILFHVHLPANLPGTLVVLFLSALATLSIGLAIGALVKNADMAFPIAIIAFVAMAFLGGAVMPLEIAPAIITTLAKFMPGYYMTDALKQVMMQGRSLVAVLPQLGIVVAMTVLLTAVAALRMRKQFLAAQ